MKMTCHEEYCFVENSSQEGLWSLTLSNPFEWGKLTSFK